MRAPAFVAAALVLSPPAFATTIRRIEIRRTAPFEVPEEPEGRIQRVSAGLWRLGNRSVVLTREYVLRRELLTKEGDELDPARLEETLRVLKAIPQVADASVAQIPAEDGSDAVDLVFTIRVNFPYELEAEVRYEGDQPLVDIPLVDDNVFGTHHAARLDYLRNLEKTAVRSLYGGPRVAGSAWDVRERTAVTWLNAEASGGRVAETALDGFAAGVAVAKPFRSIYDRWRVALLADALEGSEVLYTGRKPRRAVFTPEGELVDEGEDPPAGSVELPAWGYRYRRRTASLAVERSFGTRWKFGAGGFADWYHTRESHLPEVEEEIEKDSPVDLAYRARIFPVEDETTVGLLVSQARPVFVAMHDVDAFKLVEYELNGYIAGVSAGRADGTFGAADPFTEFRASLLWGVNLGSHVRLAGRSAGFSRRLDDGEWRQTLTTHLARLYLLAGHAGVFVIEGEGRAGFEASGALVGRDRFDLSAGAAPYTPGAYLDAGAPGVGGFDVHQRPLFPFSGGASTGFRAFQNNAFVGDRYERGTAEARTGCVHLFSVDWGLALFYDVGRVYYDDQGPSPLLQDAGLGLRIQIVGAFSSILRLDGAYAISGAPDRSSRVPVNFTVEQTF